MTHVDEMLYLAADRLGPLRSRVVFVGGAVTGLLVTDPGAAESRPTDDIDVVFEVASYFEYRATEIQLHALGFENDTRSGAPTCRYLHGALVLDLMPTNESVLGYTNIWYHHTVKSAEPFLLRRNGRPNLEIQLVTPACFLATKLEAFRDRGGGDLLHRDVEDIVALVDGRSTLVSELVLEDPPLTEYIAAGFQWLLGSGLASQLRGHLAHDASGDGRLPILLDRFLQISRAQSGTPT